MTRFMKVLSAGCGLVLSLAAQATNYTTISGATFDLYYDSAVFGNTISLSGTTLSLGGVNTVDGFSFNGNTGKALIIVPHAGYDLSHLVTADFSATAFFGPGSGSAQGYNMLNGGTFSGGVFQFQSTVAETRTTGDTLAFDGPPQNQHVATSEIWQFDFEPDAHYAAYSLNIEAYASAYDDNGWIALSSPALTVNFALTGAPVTAVPEAETWLMLAAGLTLIARRARKRSAT